MSDPTGPTPPPPRSYVEYPPSDVLRRYVECYWSAHERNPGGGGERRILPDGAMDIMTSIGPRGPRPVSVVGTMTRALVLPPVGPELAFGVRFRPGGARAFFSVPASELTDLSIALTDLWPDAEAFSAEMYACLERHPEDPRLVAQAVDALLVARLARAGPLDRRVTLAAQEIAKANGVLSIAVLSSALGVSRQQLARLFAEHVGVAPKVFARVMRLRGALEIAAKSPEPDWSTLALDAGYYDQSHLVSEFRELVGLTPTAYWLGRPRRPSG
jgi:AraC-like DNA-binding protein